MPGSSDANLDALLRQLRVQYVADSDDRVAELRDSLARVESGEQPALDELRRRFHKLAGSGGSYGLPDVTDRSRAGEQAAVGLLQAGAPPGVGAIAALRAHVEAVAGAFAAAKQAG